MEFWRLMALVTAVVGIVGLVSGSVLPGLGLLAISAYSAATSRAG